MKKWFFGVITGFFLAFTLIALAGVYGVMRGDRARPIHDNTTLELELELGGDVPEQSTVDVAGQLLGEHQPATMLALVRAIERAKSDVHVAGILLRPSRNGLGWAKLQQLRRALADFRKSGKKVTAQLNVASSRDYYLATVADKVYLSPGGGLDVKGIRAEVMFFKDALGKIGVEADLEQIGAYKNYADVFKTNRMSDEFREATTSMMESVYDGFLKTVAEARNKPVEEIQKIIEDTAPFEPERTLAAGLVDALKYADEVETELRAGKSEFEAPRMDLEDYAAATRPTRLDSGKRIAVVYAVGDIMPGEEDPNPVMGGKTMGADTMAEVLRDVQDDEDIQAVVVRIDSPGGDAFASDEIWRNMTNLSKKKPLVYSMSDAAASGGYYLAMTGDPIVAEPGTATGSIGIVYGKFNLKGLYEKLGLSVEVISRGRYAGLDSVTDGYSPEERARVRELMEDFYKKFLQKVATARKMTPEQVDKLAQGRVWTGAQAKANGLVDELGGIERALEMVKKEAGIGPSEEVVVVEYPRPKRLLDIILERTRSSARALTTTPLDAARGQLEQIEHFTRTSAWARMPAEIAIH